MTGNILLDIIVWWVIFRVYWDWEARKNGTR